MHVFDDDDRDRIHDAEVDVVDLEWVAGDGGHAGLVRLDVRRRAGASRFLAAVLVAGEEPVVVLDHELPPVTGRFELRAPGVWTELCCETPLDHWTVGLEAFGLALPATTVVTPDSLGDRTPLGLDLDLDTVEAPVATGGGFEIAVRVHGEVLLGDRAIELDGTGIRRRRWDGTRPTSDRLGSPPPFVGELSVAWPPEDGPPTVERRAWFVGSRPGWCRPTDDQSWV